MSKPSNIVWTEEEFLQAADESHNWSEMKLALGLRSNGRPMTRAKLQLESYGEKYQHLIPSRRLRHWTDERIIEAVANSEDWVQVYRQLGIDSSGSTKQKVRERAIELGCDISALARAAKALRNGNFGQCANCLETLTKRSKFCNVQCYNNFSTSKRSAYIASWLDGGETGITASGLIKSSVKKYMLENANYSCVECGWDKVHPIDGLPLVQVDHIDGNSYNGSFENLRVICPNCHSMTPTYGFRNSGNGRSAMAQKLGFSVRHASLKSSELIS